MNTNAAVQLVSLVLTLVIVGVPTYFLVRRFLHGVEGCERCAELRMQLDMLYGKPFSARCYYALVDRLAKAEAENEILLKVRDGRYSLAERMQPSGKHKY